MTCILFDNKTVADTITYEVAVTPCGVWLWFNPDEPVNYIQYLVGADGKCAMLHRLNDDDIEWLTGYLEGVPGVSILPDLPSDWKYPEGV